VETSIITETLLARANAAALDSAAPELPGRRVDAMAMRPRTDLPISPSSDGRRRPYTVSGRRKALCTLTREFAPRHSSVSLLVRRLGPLHPSIL
jgi:hypothetical protein